MSETISTKEAAIELGVSPARVRAMLASGRLIGEKIGRDWFIAPEALNNVRDRQAGRPRKAGKK